MLRHWLLLAGVLMLIGCAVEFARRQFSRKKITPADLVELLTMVVLDPDIMEPVSERLKKQGIEVSNQMEAEFLCLRMFAVLVSVGVAFNYHKLSELVNRHFLDRLMALTNNTLQPTGESAAALKALMQARTLEYTERYGQWVAQGGGEALQAVGSSFAKNCGSEDVVLAMHGSIHFRTTFKAVKKLLNSVRVI